MNRKPKSRTNSVTNSFVIELSTAIIFKWNVLSLSNNDLTLEIMNKCWLNQVDCLLYSQQLSNIYSEDIGDIAVLIQLDPIGVAGDWS